MALKVMWYCCMYPDCKREFKTKFNLKRHVQTNHLKQRRFQCLFCGKLFSSKQTLAEHVYIHSGERPFVCLECGAAFRQASQLSVHRRIHRPKGKLVEHGVKPHPFSLAMMRIYDEVHLESGGGVDSVILPRITSERKGECSLPSLLTESNTN